MPRHKVLLMGSILLALVACDKDSTGPETGPDFGPTPTTLSLEKIGTFNGGGVAAAEITAFDSASRRLFVVNGTLGTVDVLDISTPSAPARVASISVSQFGAGVNSVAVHDGVVALAIEGVVKTSPGTVAFYRADNLQLLSSVPVGALPDMVTFTPSGSYLLVANEGEPNDAYTIDPEGSVSIIDVRNVAAPTVRTADFSSYNGQVASLRASGIRIFGPNASVAQDVEPEYITVSGDSRTAYVTLQEANALAIVNVEAATVTSVLPWGYKNHNVAGAWLDASDRDGATGGPLVNILPWPVRGMYQPDAIASYSVAGQTYLVTANEGDARDYAGLREEARVSTLALNPSIFTDAACGGGPCTAAARLGRLNVTSQLGRNASGQFDTLFVFGARSFSIWTTSAQLVFDSGDQLEQRTTALPNAMFNASNTGNALDDRSDNKGPEPEGVALARFGTKTFAFIGLERVGGVIVYDVTTPAAPVFVTYFSSRSGDTGDLGPEGLLFISATQSPSGKPLLIVGNEISGTTAIFQINLI
ncbi:MAG: choice-of-anchor I family protein [Anaerolineae bacterium]|nr:choice-of-anchor I family protein [Gemmatimonadaceae bacterium]